MKKTYSKPTLAKEQKLTAITAVPVSSKGSVWPPRSGRAMNRVPDSRRADLASPPWRWFTGGGRFC